MIRRMLMVLAVLVLATGVVAQDATQHVVLKGGQTLEVQSARVAGGMVYVTFPSGEMRAYAKSDVDLEASGLAPRKEGPEGLDKKKGPKGLADFATARKKESRVSITDADVEHVRVGLGEEEESGDKKAAGESATGKLVVAVQRFNKRGNQVSVQGAVTNQGPFPVTGVMLEGVAKNGAGKAVGTAQKAVGGTIAPNGSAGFSIIIPVQSDDVQGASVHVTGAMAAAAVTRPPEPEPTPEGSPESGE